MEFTLARLFPEGTEVSAYPKSNWPVPGEPAGTPVGAATDTQEVEDGEVSFTGLAGGEEYWAAAEVGGRYRYVSFLAGAPTGISGARDNPEEALKELLAALSAKGIVKDESTES